MHTCGREFREKNKGKWIEIDRLAGSCLLMKYGVLDKIGLHNLEKWTDLSLFDTDILSMKARPAGFTLTVCRVSSTGTRIGFGAERIAANGQN